ncbi:MAG TPA: carbohydrate kinase [Bacteroidales bacterium]|nr:carbohydrate kinase [Bacteroidales bacterium]
MNKIVGIGEILWDVFPQGKILGGAPANFAYHVSQFGLEGIAVSAIGNDELGREIQANLKEKALQTVLQVVEKPTGTVQVTLDGKGIPHYEICENVAWDNIPFTDELEALAAGTKTVCFGSLAQRNDLSHRTILRFLDALPHDAIKVFDINLRQHFYSKALIEESLKRCNILKINDDEVKIVADLFQWNNLSEMEVCQRLKTEFHLDMVVLTKGTEGSHVISNEKTTFKPTPLVEVADTVGAGDSFTATFVAALLKGKDLEEAHEFAVQVSAFVCTQKGAMPKLPDHMIF